jgi:hypothetical protein
MTITSCCGKSCCDTEQSCNRIVVTCIPRHREVTGLRLISQFSSESLNRRPDDSEYIDVLTARRRQHMRTAQIVCERPGAELRRRLVPDVGHHRDCLHGVTGLDTDDLRPSADELALVIRFAARLRAERDARG